MQRQSSVFKKTKHELGLSHHSIPLWQLILCLMLWLLTPLGQAQSQLSVTSFQQTYRAIGPGANLYQYRYRVQLTNTSATKAYGVSVTATSAKSGIFIAKQVLTFGDVEAHASATSSQELSIYAQGNTVPQVNDVQWTFSQVPLPIANAGPDQNVAVHTLVTLDASASSSPAGLALSYAWRIVSQPTGSQATLSNPNALRPTLLVDRPGRYECELTVSSGAYNPPYTSEPDCVVITTENTQPVADAGPAQTQPLGSVVTLDGSASHDADDDPLTYYWTFISKPNASQAILPNSSPVNPFFTLDKPGNYLIQLIVNDGYQNSAPATVSVTTQNSPPIAHAGNDQTGFVNDLITLDASASTDVDGDALTYHWSLLSKPEASQAQLSDAYSITPQFILDQPGHYAAQLVVSDAQSSSAADNVTVTTLNSRPVAKAGEDQAVSVNSTVALDGSASDDADHDNLTYHWQLTSKPQDSQAEIVDTTQVNPSFVVDKPGSYIAHLTVNDGRLDSEPDSITITTLNSRPVADAGADQLATSPNIYLTGDASHDADGDSLSYRWSLLSKPDGSQAAIDPINTPNSGFSADYPGMYISQLIVNDGQLDSLPDTSLIDVPETVFNAVTIPNLIGQTRSQAVSALIAANLSLGDVRYDYSDTIPVDSIISQTPSAAHQTQPGSPVTLVISLGVNTGLPDDPEQVASPINPALPVTPLKQATEFLYTGEHPIQTGGCA